MKNSTCFLYFSVFIPLMITESLSGQVKLNTASTVSSTNTSTFRLKPEYAFIHTDRDIYIAGENMYFKMYIVSGESTTAGKPEGIAYMILRNEKQNIVNALLKIENGASFGYLYIPDTLKTGSYQLLGYTNYMKNFGEKAFFIKKILIINRFDKLLPSFYSSDTSGFAKQILENTISNSLNNKAAFKITPEKDSFKIRGKIKISISLISEIGKQVGSSVSISIKELSPFNYDDAFMNYYSNQGSNELSVGMKQGTDPYYVSESKGIFLKGIVQHSRSVRKSEDCLLLSTIDTVPNLQYSFTEKTGRFHFLLDNYFLGKDLYIKLRDEALENELSKISLEDKFAIKQAFKATLPVLNIERKKYIFNSQDLVQVQKTFAPAGPKILNAFEKEKIRIPVVYINPNFVCYPSNYIPLNDFEEIATNLLIGFKLKKEKEQSFGYIKDYLSQNLFTRPCLIFLNGVPIDNLSQIMNLSSEDIYKIEMCNYLKTMGNIELPGVISIITRKIKAELSIAGSSIKFRFDKFLPAAVYQTPDYSDKTALLSKIPDLRQLLYWNPDLQLKENESSIVEFYASDYFTEYLVEVKGISSEGKPLSATARIKITR